jgi:hypothetical protein
MQVEARHRIEAMLEMIKLVTLGIPAVKEQLIGC